MALNVGGAVFGLVVLTVIANSVTANHGGQDLTDARVYGYKASFYGAVAWAVIAVLISILVVFKDSRKARKAKDTREESATSSPIETVVDRKTEDDTSP